MTYERLSLRRSDWAAIVVAAILALAVGIISHEGQPTVDDVVGIYESECCGDIKIFKSSIEFAGSSSEVKFYHMKDGLAGYIDSPIGIFYDLSSGSAKPAVIYFDSSKELHIQGFNRKLVHFTRKS